MIPSLLLKNIKTVGALSCILVFTACSGAPKPNPEPEPDPNVSPTVSVTAPQAYRFDSSGAVTQPNAVAISAIIADADDNLDKVELFIDNTKVGQTLKMAPFEWAMNVATGLSAGAHTLKVVATDTEGASQSDQASVQVSFNSLPTVSIGGVANMADVEFASSLNVSVNAQDTDGQIQSVDLRLDNQSLGSKNQAPYNWNAANVSALSEISVEGRHDLEAIAVDNDGESSTTQIFFTVKDKPTTGGGGMPKPGMPREENIVGVGPYGACAIDSNEKPRCWGGNYLVKGCSRDGRNVQGAGEGNCVGRALPPKNIAKIFAIAGYHVGACALLKQPVNGSNIRCWGPEGAPKGPKWDNAVQLAGGDRHVCVLRETGDVNCFQWGNAALGKKQAPNGLKARFIAGSHLFNCAIRMNDNKVQCWGDNPPNPPGNLQAKALSASRDTVCAIALDDSVVCWGAGKANNPPNNLKARSVAAGTVGGCAIKLDGSPQCWGHNHVPNDKGPNYTSVFVSPNPNGVGPVLFVKKDRSVVEAKTFNKKNGIFEIENFKVITPP